MCLCFSNFSGAIMHNNGLALGEEADFIIIFICDQDLKFLE